MKATIPAIIGAAAGLVTAAVAAGAVREHRQISGARARITPHSAALFGALPIDRQSRVVTEDGISLHVEEVGPRDAPLTVVFVHGFTLNLGSFHFQRLALAEEFGHRIRMVFYDLRSHGRSDRSPADHSTLSRLGLDLGAVIDEVVPAGPIVLIAHSLGGMVAMHLANQRPDLLYRGRNAPGRISDVVMLNTSGGGLRSVTLGLPSLVARFHGPVMPALLRRAARNVDLVEKGREVGKDLAWIITKRLSFDPDNDVDPAVVSYCTSMISATRVDVVSEFYPMVMAHDGSLGLMNLTECRVLLFGAGHDLLTPLSHSEAIAAALPDAELVAVQKAGHLLMLERPQTVNPRIIDAIMIALSSSGDVAPRVRA